MAATALSDPRGNRAAAPALLLRGVSKAFQGQWALQDVDLSLAPGEVHALLGQNGSGKSTLIKLLAGYHQPDGVAEAQVAGQPLRLGAMHDAHALGLRFIHQDRALIADLSVTDNLALGERDTRWWLSDRRERRAAREALLAYEIDVDVAAPLRWLDPAQQTMVAMVRALRSDAVADGVLVLDEPTAALTERETALLFSVIRRVRDRGGTVLFVTHRLAEVFDIADRVTVLRDGRRVTTVPVGDIDHDRLVELIIGRPLEELASDAAAAATPDHDLLRVHRISGGDVRTASLSIGAGEIVGVTGPMGSGMDSLLALVFGAIPRSGGQVLVDRRPLTETSPRGSIRAGMAFAPSDRQKLSGLRQWTLRENVTLPKLPSRGPLRWMSTRAEVAEAQPWLDRLEVTPSDCEALFSSLSGGNQQKTVLARWLRCGARVFLLQEPTAGVDVGSKRAIYASLRNVASGGAAVLLASSDLEEVCAVCDRALVMRNGAITATLSGSSLTVDALLAESVRALAPSANERSGS
jgi:ribose transport system ATP-binding protein